MKKLMTALTLSAALLVPVGTFAQDRDHDQDHDRRYYDQEHDRRYYDARHKDYHHWDDREDRAYHMYWEQRHHAYVDWDRATEAQREAYWNWRHNHSDSELRIDIR